MSVAVTPGSGATIAADTIGTGSAPSGGQQIGYVKVDYGTTGASQPVDATHGLPVQAVGNLPVQGPAAAGAAVAGNPLLYGGKDCNGNAQPMRTSSAAAAANVNVPASNTDAVLTYAAAGAGVCHVIDYVAWSYSGTPTGRLTIKDGSTTVFDVDITAGGPGFFSLKTPIKGTANTAMEVRVYAGGSGVTGKVNAPGKWTE